MMYNAESSSSATTGLYAKHFGILQAIADRLRSGGPADVDALLEDTRRALESYEICRSRLDAVRAELNAQVGRSFSTDRLPMKA
ncbi:exodeoxyribonuclease VII small subunit [Microvirga guangxiensis]|uniref:Exodeoxyribonuclease VII small subunit n=1 Tax=Microvirga guangxiensis TaxID=549386 RepID=A0A1G5LK90_9HYPH|nr:exodeoxyribonuclease VII small subunit [Microvirga guangxiensis]SCZ12708.1 Exodeoxyribonuclease VII small subunit [Microvirga guangxiensis]